MKRTLLGIGLACGVLSVPATAGIPVEEKMTCPIGGETFTYTATASYSTFGSRPDGKPYGSWTFPIPLPECPTNRLVLYREFQPQELVSLDRLIGSDAYRALSDDTPYYRAQWLENRLSETPVMPWLLMRAIWQTDQQPALRTRYLAEFVDQAGVFAADPADADTLFLAYRRVNALRELGRFDEARTALALIPADPSQSEDLAWLADQIPLMRAVIDTGDRSRIPYSLVPEDVASLRCAYEAEQGQTPAAWCLDPQHQDSVQKASRELDEMEEFRETVLREIGLM